MARRHVPFVQANLIGEPGDDAAAVDSLAGGGRGAWRLGE